METINDIQFNGNLFSQFDCSVVLLYQIEGVGLAIPISDRNLFTFIRFFNEIIPCQDFIKRENEKTFSLFTYSDNIERWLWNHNPIPDNLEEILIFCPFPDNVQYYTDWTRHYTKKVTKIVTFDQLERELLIFGARYISNLWLDFQGDNEIRDSLRTHLERIHAALENAIEQAANNIII